MIYTIFYLFYRIHFILFAFRWFLLPLPTKIIIYYHHHELTNSSSLPNLGQLRIGPNPKTNKSNWSDKWANKYLEKMINTNYNEKMIWIKRNHSMREVWVVANIYRRLVIDCTIKLRKAGKWRWRKCCWISLLRLANICMDMNSSIG